MALEQPDFRALFEGTPAPHLVLSATLKIVEAKRFSVLARAA